MKTTQVEIMKSNQAKILELKKTNEMKTWLEFQQQI